ncbi:MAG: hypothetical protein V7704_19460 [Aurantimonas endophytica]|uniref:hypothetical protein n=1 Tax=Aurantimonas endophytica TaxID=1522175 RepID=UPI003002EEA6
MLDVFHNDEASLVGLNVIVSDGTGKPYMCPGKPLVAGYLDRLRENGDRIGFIPETVPMQEVFTSMWVPEDLELVAPRPVVEATVSATTIKADGTGKAVISGLPKPCTIRVDGKPVERKGGTLTLTADVPATYRIEVDQWPYMPWATEIVAT